ncbi:MAG: ATP-dependent 6-phosphofructokinase [Candidatus Omnitrophica bacterium]|nr:ATP-dependent 6-phosphofructokinase [Candidatus Omnitrophota bacterium]MDD5080636.1 ATP-dependent 6-phosphofructokinase [Candidatus Omnitrophota bacterium]MDD5440839.1 ATP-dependent 6-phosphofructokinase [Candidatus Omnitrophota bacterium]
MKRIGLLTRDCSGVNAAIRAVVRTAYQYDIEVYGFMHGYNGLMDNDWQRLDRRSVAGIIHLGGTILKTARSQRFKTPEGQQAALKTLKDNEIDGLIVIGGNGSLTGAYTLSSKYDFPVIGVPATIDNDINGVEYTIGAHTAVNVALDALDKIRDTAISMERIFIVEVMGRDCGYIASRVALAGGCEELIVPERDYNIDDICARIKAGHASGKVTWIIIVSEGKAHAADILHLIQDKTGFETRQVVLGHIQRGGSPLAFDRILAARLGNFAVELLKKGEAGKCVCLNTGQLGFFDLKEVTKPKDIEVDTYFDLIKILT